MPSSPPPKTNPLHKYSVQKTLGQGSFGKALLVRRSGSAKPSLFVMKEIQIGHLSKKEKATSIAEASVLASMHHSNICSYVESFLNPPANTILYIVSDRHSRPHTRPHKRLHTRTSGQELMVQEREQGGSVLSACI